MIAVLQSIIFCTPFLVSASSLESVKFYHGRVNKDALLYSRDG